MVKKHTKQGARTIQSEIKVVTYNAFFSPKPNLEISVQGKQRNKKGLTFATFLSGFLVCKPH